MGCFFHGNEHMTTEFIQILAASSSVEIPPEPYKFYFYQLVHFSLIALAVLYFLTYRKPSTSDKITSYRTYYLCYSSCESIIISIISEVAVVCFIYYWYSLQFKRYQKYFSHLMLFFFVLYHQD